MDINHFLNWANNQPLTNIKLCRLGRITNFEDSLAYIPLTEGELKMLIEKYSKVKKVQS